MTDPPVVDGLRYWTTSATLEANPTLMEVASTSTMTSGKAVGPDQLQQAELLKLFLRENSITVYALHRIIVEV